MLTLYKISVKYLLRIATYNFHKIIAHFTTSYKPDRIRIMRDYEFYYTQDGSLGLYSYTDNDVYHSKFGAVTESWEKFILPSNIANLIHNTPNINVLDVCYGIGYNTKALMSFVINSNEKYLKQENYFQKINKKIFYIFKKLQKFFCNNIHNESIDSNNTYENNKKLLEYIETNENEYITKLNIDCLEINEELVKISPLLKTVITPQEMFSRIVPRFLDCFESYWKIRKFLSKITYKFCPKNKKNIADLLDLKFNNDYNELNEEYRIHEFVNYIIIDALAEQYHTDYLNNEIKKIINDRSISLFFAPSLLRYAKFKQTWRYKLLSKLDLLGNLHNIYYDHLSNRYKKAKFKLAEKLFNIKFFVNDARTSILELNKQYDLIFLDAFTYSKAPELWSVEFISELYNRLSKQGILLTYSNSALVRNALLENNFYVGKIYNEKTGKFIGTIAAKEKNLIEHPLSNYEIGLCNTKAGIPYHDYTLNSTKDVILKRREQDFKTSKLLTSSQYIRLRTIKKGDSDEE